jgi:anti-anti-sigma factor
MIGSFIVEIAGTGDELLVTCSGEFDLATAERFREAITEVVSAKPRHVHVDCSGVTFIDSMGIRALLHTATTCRDGQIILTLNMSPSMRRLFDTVGVTEMFTLVP